VLRLRRGRYLQPATRRARAAGKLRIVVRPDRAGRRELAREGVISVKANLQFTSAGAKSKGAKRLRLRQTN
jgi:hypothetical protein